ncbi:MAG: hypothetical protein C5B50_21660 [Verrucomicrobia bacterium]|nr:MAG: hypothetical protein C5B50_21660 [Verrucomicrobiota bacterium]
MRHIFAVISAAAVLLRFAGTGVSGTLYWDTDGSAAGDNASTGANLGGSGAWNTAAANWWSSGAVALQAWGDGSDAIFWGTAGAVSASAVSPDSLTFKSTGYSIDSGPITMIGTPSNFTVDSNVTATINATISGTNTMWKLGAGTLILANTNNLNNATTNGGGWRIEGGGTLQISADTSLGAALPDTARNTVTDISFNQSTIQAGTSLVISQNRRTKINTNVSTNAGDAIIDVHGYVVTWYGSLQGGPGSLRVRSSDNPGGMLILGTDKIASINPWGSTLAAGTVNLTIQDGSIVQTSGTVTPTGGELGSETNTSGAALAILLDNGQIRSESGGYAFMRNLMLGAGGGSLDTGAWDQTFLGAISGSGSLTKWGTGNLILDNTSAGWTGGTFIHSGTLVLGRNGSNGMLPGTIANPYSISIDAGATFKFSRGSNKSFFDIFSGAGGVVVANSPTAKVRLVSDSTYTGPTTIGSGILMIGQGNPGEPGSIASPMVNNSGELDFNRVEDLTYAGAISGPGILTKQAAGKLTLSGTNSYTGFTGVNAGSLIVAGILGNSAVFVTNGILGGNGLIQGPVTILPSGTLSPGTSIGALTISNSLTLSGTTAIELNVAANTNDLVRGLTSVAYGGTLTLSNLAGTFTAPSGFKLFSANSYTGRFATLTPTNPASGLGWNTNTLSTDGTLRILSIAPVSISNAISGNNLTLSWPADHTGWRLQSKTNFISGSNWADVPNSAITNQVTIILNPGTASAFYRLVYP